MEGHRDHLRSARHVPRLITRALEWRPWMLRSMHNIGSTDRPNLLTRRALLRGCAVGALAGWAAPVSAATRLDITQGTFEPMPIAVPDFVGGTPGDGDVARNVTQIIVSNLTRSGLFAPIDPAAYIEKIVNTDTEPRFADWRAINAQALVTGRITRQSDG